jgi:4-amino-4-deoxy-L-arabinose transferase-like glycosyltransferase
VTHSQTTSHQDLLQRLASRWLWPLAGLIIAVKALFAVRLELYSDEIFYWLESTRPALAYSDLPFMSALFAGLGAAAFGRFSLRSAHSLLPHGLQPACRALLDALPLVGKIEAREAALLSLCLPLASSLGLLAVPDVPLVFFGLLAIGFFTRARTSNATILWVATGVVVALGLATHYRFSLFPAGAILLLLWDTQSRHLWRNPRTLLAFVVAAVGLMPVIAVQYSAQDGKPDVLPSRPASLGVSPRGATPFIRAGIDIDAPDVWASARYSHLRASERNSLR